jgi:hypothetical protein
MLKQKYTIPVIIYIIIILFVGLIFVVTEFYKHFIYKSITLSGYAYEDRNGNDIFDAADVKLPIRDLHWFDTNNQSLKFTFQTDSNGNFSITTSTLDGLSVEGFVLNDLRPIRGVQLFSKNTNNIAIGFRSINTSQQAGLGIIEGDIFQDSNRNGSRDNGENGVYFYKLYLVDIDGGIYNTIEGTQTTEQDGHFKYTKLPYGEYKIQLSNPTDQYIIDKPQMFVIINPTNPSVTDIQIPILKL